MGYPETCFLVIDCYWVVGKRTVVEILTLAVILVGSCCMCREVNLTGLIWVSCNDCILPWVIIDMSLMSQVLRGHQGLRGCVRRVVMPGFT